MSGTSIRKQALKEIAREKARSYGKRSPSFGSFQEIPSWQEAKEDEVDVEELASKESILNVSPPIGEKIVEEPSSSQLDTHRIPSFSGFTWQQFSPWGETKKKEKPRYINTVTIWCAAKKMIAQEWRRAVGVKKRDRRLDQLEQEAAIWNERREEEEKKEQQAKLKLEKYKRDFEKPLRHIGKIMIEEKDNITLKRANKLVVDALGNVGKVYNLDWKDDGLDVWIEPWEEKWARQKRGGSHPAVCCFRINDHLEIDSVKLIEDEEAIVQKKKMMERDLGSSIDKEEVVRMDDEEINLLLEKKLSEMGRVIDLKRFQDNRWIASIELWEEVRQRNIKGRGSVARTQIEINCSEGKFSFVPQARK